MRFIDYDKLQHAIEKKLLEYTPHALKNDYMRGCADGLHWALHVIECQDKFVSWETMCLIKDMFFYPDEDAIQYHPKASSYFHGFDTTKHCLHLWRPMKGDWKILNNPERWG